MIEAIDAQVLEGGHLRILFYRGWTSTKPTDSREASTILKTTLSQCLTRWTTTSRRA